MIPLKDLTARRSTPFVTLTIIAANVLVFFYQLSLGRRPAEAFVMTYGLVPANIQYALAGAHHVTFLQALLPLFTCMFLHGGWLHIIGNMWFLWVFGASVEDRLGTGAYLLFYLVCGIGSGLAQVLFSWGSHLPSIGASGAISGILGAYIVFSPGASILTIVPLFILWFTVRIPAIVFIGLWFVMQFFSGVQSLSVPGAANAGGVAWWAHVGGFVLGVVLALIVRAERPRSYPSYE